MEVAMPVMKHWTRWSLIGGLMLNACGTTSGIAGLQGESAGALRARELRQVAIGFRRMPDPELLTRLAARHGLSVVKALPAIALVVVRCDREPGATLRALATEPEVAFAEPDAVINADPPRAIGRLPFPGFRTDTGDPGRSEQYYLDRIAAPGTWQLHPNLAPVNVAVVDTGVDLTHPDLAGRLLPGYNAPEPGQPPQDFDGHGTSTAGCVGAVANNGIGIAGVAPNARIIPVKVSWTASSIAECMLWAADRADLITMSLSVKPADPNYLSSHDTLLRAALYVQQKGVPMLCSMGNTSNQSANLPAAFAGNEAPALIAVGATDARDTVAHYSTTGPWISLVAPGTAIYTLEKDGTYGWNDGTSFATPIAAGVAAMLIGSGFGHDPLAVKARLMGTADDVDAPGFDNRSGAGRINALRALAARQGEAR
jgi:subtilisin family serine protease